MIFADMKWFIPERNKLQAGDILEISSKVPNKVPLVGGTIVPVIKHFGMVVFIDGKLSVAHNPYLGVPIIETYEAYTKDRKVERVMRTFLTNEQVLERFEEYKHHKYTFCKYNCEDFIRDMCDCCIGTNQCKVWGVSLMVLITIIIILIFIFSKAK